MRPPWTISNVFLPRQMTQSEGNYFTNFNTGIFLAPEYSILRFSWRVPNGILILSESLSHKGKADVDWRPTAATGGVSKMEMRRPWSRFCSVGVTGSCGQTCGVGGGETLIEGKVQKGCLAAPTDPGWWACAGAQPCSLPRLTLQTDSVLEKSCCS